MLRTEKLAIIYRHTHRDFKGRNDQGDRCILVLRDGITQSVPLSCLTSAEIEDKLRYSLKQEQERTRPQISRSRKAGTGTRLR